MHWRHVAIGLLRGLGGAHPSREIGQYIPEKRGATGRTVTLLARIRALLDSSGRRHAGMRGELCTLESMS